MRPRFRLRVILLILAASALFLTVGAASLGDLHPALCGLALVVLAAGLGLGLDRRGE